MKAGFEEFYQAYPYKVGRTHAEKVYHRALKTNGVTHATIIDVVSRFAAAHAAAGTEKRFIPHPATWLNGSRWEDDLSGITARWNATQPAAKARGSQFNAALNAAAELIQEESGHLRQGLSGLSEWSLGVPLGLPDQSGSGSGLPSAPVLSDQAGVPTIDHDGFDPADDGKAVF